MYRPNLVRWVMDEDGDLGIAFFGGLITLIKYKHSIIIEWFKFKYQDAPKYVRER